jgi:hypothetical protein
MLATITRVAAIRYAGSSPDTEKPEAVNLGLIPQYALKALSAPRACTRGNRGPTCNLNIHLL